MKLTYNRSSRQINWIKWTLITLCLIVVTCLVYGILLYNTIQKNKMADFDETIALVIQDTDIIEVSSIERYHGGEAYHIVYGQTSDQEDKIAFVPIKVKKDQEKNQQDLVVVNEEDTLSKIAIQKQWEEQCNACELKKIIPGIENDQVIWEITYIDDSDRHVLEYVSIYDGSQQEKFRFTQMYK